LKTEVRGQEAEGAGETKAAEGADRIICTRNMTDIALRERLLKAEGRGQKTEGDGRAESGG